MRNHLIAIGLIVAAIVASPAAAEVASADPAMISRGLDLFQGTARFSAGGPSCSACHHVTHDAIVGGGNLATDLTESYGRLEGGIIDTLPRKDAPSPFPVMQAAFVDRDITADEAQALIAFLRHAHEKRAEQKANDPGAKLVGAGVVGVTILLILFSFFGRDRKRRSVNQEIYDRQLRAE